MKAWKIALMALLLAVCAAAGAESTEIVDPAGLFAISRDPGGSYILEADIDMEGQEWLPLEFSGVLDGNGHTIYNLSIESFGDERDTTVDGNHLEYDTALAGLFSRVENASIHDLTLLNVDIRLTTEDSAFIACLAGVSKASVIENVSVTGRAYLYIGGKMGGVAGLVGFGTGAVKDCDADVTLVYVDTNTGVKCEQFLGGVLACGYMDVTGCDVKIDGYASVHGYVHTGGLVGMHHNHDKSGYKGVVQGCTSQGRIAFFEHNNDRRAYCKAFVGEKLNNNVTISGNTDLGFEKLEIKTYNVTLLPEMCADPDYAYTTQMASCAGFGYNEYVCKGCGYAYRDEYTAPTHVYTTRVILPTCTEGGYTQYTCALCGDTRVSDETPAAHTPGQWVVTRDASYDADGERQLLCAVCGASLANELMQKLVYVSVCAPDKSRVEIGRGETLAMRARIEPENAANRNVVWKSSDESVCAVSAEGVISGISEGNATVFCESEDGAARGSCEVTVNRNLTPMQEVVLLIMRTLGFE